MTMYGNATNARLALSYDLMVPGIFEPGKKTKVEGHPFPAIDDVSKSYSSGVQKAPPSLHWHLSDASTGSLPFLFVYADEVIGSYEYASPHVGQAEYSIPRNIWGPTGC
jgi:hypothetical protein